MSKKVRRWMSLVLAGLMLLSLFGCGGDNAEGQATGEGDGQQGSDGSGYLIGFINHSMANTWIVQMEAEFKYHADELKKEGVISDYIMTNAQGDSTKQISDMQDLITKGCDAIIVSAGNPDALAPVCEEAVAEGITVISADQLVNSDKMDAYVSFRYYDYGKSIGDFMMENLPDGGKIIILAGIAGSAGTEDQIKGFNDAIAGSNIEVLTTSYCNWDYAKAKQAMESLVTAYPEIDGIASMGGSMTQAALDVLDAAGRSVAIPISGEANNGYLKAWKKYKDKGYIGCAPASLPSQCATALDVAIECLNGNPPADNRIYVEIPVITEETLDDYLREDYSDSFWNFTILPDEILDEMYKE